MLTVVTTKKVIVKWTIILGLFNILIDTSDLYSVEVVSCQNITNQLNMYDLNNEFSNYFCQ